MCETLKGKKHYEVNNPPCRYGEFNYEYFDYEDVKSAVKFYKRYRWNGGDSFKRLIENKLYNESPKTYLDWIRFKENFIEEYSLNVTITIESGVVACAESEYNDWLFDYTFKDVIE